MCCDHPIALEIRFICFVAESGLLTIMAFFVVIVIVVIQHCYWSLMNYDPNYDFEKSLLFIVGSKTSSKRSYLSKSRIV